MIREAVDLFRDCPDVFNASLASSLNGLSTLLAHQGREAVDLCRQLAAGHPSVFNADLASSLNNFYGCLAHLGHHDHALEAIREAVDLFRQLAAGRPDVFNPSLASSLNGLSARLSHLGHHEHALEANREAAERGVNTRCFSFSRFPPYTPSPYLAKEGFNCNAVENWIRSEPNVLRAPSSSESGINPARYVGAPAVDPLTFRNTMARHFIYTLYTT